MTGFDIAVVAVILLSALLGWWRGFMYELFSLIAWGVAYVVAVTFSEQLVQYVPDAVGSANIRSATAFAALFIVTLIVGSISAWFMTKLAKFAGLTGMDGKFGAMFGVVRGVILVLALVWIGGLTNLPQETWWKNAWSSKPLQEVAFQAKSYVPEDAFKN
ncbi:MAG: membrane protein required for colicin V production [Gallionellaceae bacterium]|nr:MAG: membrane protein required for colicin V production [Gallionellaceae bacterium]